LSIVIVIIIANRPVTHANQTYKRAASLQIRYTVNNMKDLDPIRHQYMYMA